MGDVGSIDKHLIKRWASRFQKEAKWADDPETVGTFVSMSNKLMELVK